MSVLQRLLLWVLAAAAAASLAVAQESEEREGGIIGTGIAGTVTSLGSIYVNGQHIRLDSGMPVEDALPAMTAADLRPGHTVAVTARLEGGSWRALHIRQVLPLAGPVEAVENGRLTILGSAVEAGALAGDVQPGDWLAVSGLWQGNRVLASRLDVVSADSPARISGTYLGADDRERHLVGGSVLGGLQPQHLQPGGILRVFGSPIPGGIAASRIETGLFGTATGLVQVEGYYSAPQPDGLYTVLGSGLVAYTSNPAMISTAERVVHCGSGGQLGQLPAQQPDLEALARKLGCKEGQ